MSFSKDNKILHQKMMEICSESDAGIDRKLSVSFNDRYHAFPSCTKLWQRSTAIRDTSRTYLKIAPLFECIFQAYRSQLFRPCLASHNQLIDISRQSSGQQHYPHNTFLRDTSLTYIALLSLPLLLSALTVTSCWFFWYSMLHLSTNYACHSL